MSMDQATQSFVTEATYILDDLEGQLLGLEANPEREAVDAVFRAMHTLKGSGGMFGFSELAAFTHHLETAFEQVRDGALAVTPPLISIALRARDMIAALLDLGGGTPEAADLVASNKVREILHDLEALTGTRPEQEVKSAFNFDNRSTTKDAEHRFRVIYRPGPTDLINGTRPDLLIRELMELGNCRVHHLIDRLPPLDQLDFKVAHLGYVLDISGAFDRSSIEDVFIFADEADIDITDLSQSKDPETALAQGPQMSGATPPAVRVSQKNKHLRVAGDRIDQIMDTIGELVISQARLDQVAGRYGDPELEGVIEEVERLVLALRDTTLSIRMLPIETVFGKFNRVVRDLSESLGKDVKLSTRGGETEIDKNVIDRLSEPLVHMIRNSLDHGIEDRETRAQAGKPPRGTIFLEARQEGGEVIIEVADDGRGLDADAIRAKAERSGTIPQAGQLADHEAYRLIFSPGFSTAKSISDVSGRGVGMDAVRTAVEELRGNINITTKPGNGTRFSLRLPVSLAIVEGLRVRLGDQVFVIPLAAVDECVEFPPEIAARKSGRRMLDIRDELVPFVPLEQVLNLPSDAESDAVRRVVVTRANGLRTGFVVDDVLGQAQTVIKPLSAYHKDIPGLSGATIMGDGTVALILDIAALAQASRPESLQPAA